MMFFAGFAGFREGEDMGGETICDAGFRKHSYSQKLSSGATNV